VRSSGAAGRAIELGERECGAQFEAAGFLALGDGDGSAEGVFGGCGVRRAFLKQDVAARAVDLRIEPLLSGAIEVLERLLECGQSGFRLAVSRFRFCQSCLDERLKGAHAILLK